MRGAGAALADEQPANDRDGDGNEATRGRPLVLVATADSELRAQLAQRLKIAGFDPVKVRDAHEALDRIGDYLMGNPPRYFGLVIVDLRLRGRKGLDLFLRLRHGDWKPPVILIIPDGDAALTAEAERLEPAAVLTWPFSLEILQLAARQVVRRR
jgi:DNA-binding response OmpR family regulator